MTEFVDDHYRRSLALTLSQSYIDYGDAGPTPDALLANARTIDAYLKDKDGNTATAIGYATGGGRFASTAELFAAIEPLVAFIANG